MQKVTFHSLKMQYLDTRSTCIFSAILHEKSDCVSHAPDFISDCMILEKQKTALNQSAPLLFYESIIT